MERIEEAASVVVALTEIKIPKSVWGWSFIVPDSDAP